MNHPMPEVIPNTLQMVFADHPDDGPDVVYIWGAGCSGADARLLHYVIGSPRANPYTKPLSFDPSMLDELVHRGYDLTTLKFSIQKRAN